jgi:plastocyanin
MRSCAGVVGGRARRGSVPTRSRWSCGRRIRPGLLELVAGTEVIIEARNEGSFGHNLTIDELDPSTGTVEPGQVVTATLMVHDGTAKYHCTFHPGMDGAIVAR